MIDKELQDKIELANKRLKYEIALTKHIISAEKNHPNHEFISGLLDDLYIEIQKSQIDDMKISNILDELRIYNAYKNTVHSFELDAFIFNIDFWLDIR